MGSMYTGTCFSEGEVWAETKGFGRAGGILRVGEGAF